MTLHSTMTWTHYGEIYSGGGQPTYQGKQTILSTAAGRITYTLCVAKSTTWSIKKAPDVIEYAYYGMDSNLNVTAGTGFALRATYVNAKSFTVEPTMCKHNGGLDFLKWVTGLPIPGVNYVVSVGVYIIGSLIPSGGNTCQAFGDVSVPVSFASSNGNTTASAVSRSYYNKVPTTFGCPSNSQCWLVDQYDWSITP